MKNTLLLWSLVLGFILPAAGQSYVCKVVGIKDGDTIEALDTKSKQTFRIRFAHIDCPESRQAFGNRAKQFTAAACAGRYIVFVQTDTDRYGRKVGVVYVDEKNINLALVEQGFAWHYKKYSSDATYANAERRARQARRGLWQDPYPIAPWDFRKRK